jgi:hypothetical protein
MLNGATLGRAYFDFFYEIVACIVILDILARRQAQELIDTAPEGITESSDELVPVAI